MRSFPLAAVLLAVGLAAAGCQSQRQSPAEAAKVVSCRAQTDRAYRVRDRASLYRPEQRDSPFSGNYSPGNTARGLGELFGRDQAEAECLRDTGAAGRTPDASTGPAFDTKGYRR